MRPSAGERLTHAFGCASERRPTMSDLRQTIPQVLLAAAQRHGPRPAIVEDGGRLTFAELKARADLFAKAVLATGLRPGERFAIWVPNMADWVCAALAGQQVGGVLVPINTRFKGLEAGDIARRSGAKLAFAASGFLGVDHAALLAGQNCPALERIVALPSLEPPTKDAAKLSAAPAESAEAPAGGAGAKAGKVLALQAFLGLGKEITDAELRRRIAAVAPEDLSDILYTSGTTGAPKGAMTSHGQNIATFAEWSAAVGLSAEDRYLIVNPFFHSFGYKAGWLAALLHGATIFPEAVFDAERTLRQIERQRISLLPGPPTLFQSLLTHPALGRTDLSSLRCAVTGAASVPVQLVRDMKNRLGFAEVYTAYGLTESSGVVSLCRSADDFETIANTCGRAMRGVQIRIAAADGRALPAGESGEVWVRGFNVMQGYLDDAAATAAAITPEGWLKTGDVGVLDRRGYLRIVDRLKDMYICGGFNCYPAEIENLLLAHPDIAEVAVLGVADQRLGEVGHAFVVRTPGSNPQAEDIQAWARAQMANYKAPRRITWVEQLPRNASGKVQKFLLAERC